MQHLPLMFLSPDADETAVLEEVTEEVKRISQQIDSKTYEAIQMNNIQRLSIFRVDKYYKQVATLQNH